jgi:Mor family transcriptional regulator
MALPEAEERRRVHAYETTRCDREAAEALGLKLTAYRKWRLERRLPRRRIPGGAGRVRYPELTDAQRLERRITIWMAPTLEDAANELRISLDALRQWMHREGLTAPDLATRWKKLQEFRYVRARMRNLARGWALLQEYTKGETGRTLAKRYNMNEQRLYMALRVYNPTKEKYARIPREKPCCNHPLRDEAIQKARAKGVPLNALAAQYGLTKQRVSQIANRGKRVQKRNTAARAVRDAAIRKDFQKGVSADDIARKYQLSRARIYAIKKAGSK